MVLNPRNIPRATWWSRFPGCAPGFFAYIWHPKTWRLARFCFSPVKASYGDLPNHCCGIMFFTYTVWTIALLQYSLLSSDEWSMHRIICPRSWWGCENSEASYRIQWTPRWILQVPPSSWMPRISPITCLGHNVPWGLSGLNFSRMAWTVSMGGSLDAVG